MTKAAIAWRWSCMRNSLESIAPRLNASWTKRIKPARIPRPCGATLPSTCWWTNRENTLAARLTANQKENSKSGTNYDDTRSQRRLEHHQRQVEAEVGQAHG